MLCYAGRGTVSTFSDFVFLWICVYQEKERKQFMSVDGVNNSNNTGLYAGAGAVLGAGAGATAGYLTKSFLKDGVPTDSFCQTLGDKLVEASNVVSEQNKKFLTEIAPMFEKMSNANNAEKLNSLYGEMIDKIANGSTLEEFKNIVTNGNCFASSLGLNSSEEMAQSLIDAKNLDEAKDIIKNMLKKELESTEFESLKADLRTTLDTIREMEIPLTSKDLGKSVWESAYDSANKKFIKDGVTDEAMSIIKKTMHSFQGKTAMIYGAIGAGILGTAGLLYGMVGGSKEQPAQPAEKVDTNA